MTRKLSSEDGLQNRYSLDEERRYLHVYFHLNHAKATLGHVANIILGEKESVDTEEAPKMLFVSLYRS